MSNHKSNGRSGAVTVRFPKQHRMKIEKLAKEQGRSLSNLIEIIVAEYFESRKSA